METDRSPGLAGIPSSPVRSRRVISSICSWTASQQNTNSFITLSFNFIWTKRIVINVIILLPGNWTVSLTSLSLIQIYWQLWKKTSVQFQHLSGPEVFLHFQDLSWLIIIIIINEVQLTWRKVAKLHGHVTKKRVTWNGYQVLRQH